MRLNPEQIQELRDGEEVYLPKYQLDDLGKLLDQLAHSFPEFNDFEVNIRATKRGPHCFIKIKRK